MLPENTRVNGRWFVANIALPENDLSTGLTLIHRDPRKQKRLPDAYLAVVEKTGPLCTLVKTGDKVVVERWSWQQDYIDEQRMWARESEVLVLANNEPAPGVIAVLLEDQKPKVQLTLPDRIKPWERRYFFGKLLAPDVFYLPDDEVIKENEYVWIMKLDHDQFMLGENCLVMRVTDPDSIVAKGVKPTQLEVI